MHADHRHPSRIAPPSASLRPARVPACSSSAQPHARFDVFRGRRRPRSTSCRQALAGCGRAPHAAPRRHDHPWHDEPEPAAPVDRWSPGRRRGGSGAPDRPRSWSTSATAPRRSRRWSCTTGCARSAPTSRWSASRSTRRGWPPASRSSGTGLTFRLGGFEVPLDDGARRAGARLQRAAPVRRGRGAGRLGHASRSAWRPDGLLVDGTCDEIGRRAAGSRVDRHGPGHLTSRCGWAASSGPSDVAERLPKSLIHRNVPGEPVHAFLADLDRAWARSAPQSSFGVRQRFLAAVARRPRPLAAARRPVALAARRAHRRLDGGGPARPLRRFGRFAPVWPWRAPPRGDSGNAATDGRAVGVRSAPCRTAA